MLQKAIRPWAERGEALTETSENQRTFCHFLTIFCHLFTRIYARNRQHSSRAFIFAAGRPKRLSIRDSTEV